MNQALLSVGGVDSGPQNTTESILQESEELEEWPERVWDGGLWEQEIQMVAPMSGPKGTLISL